MTRAAASGCLGAYGRHRRIDMKNRLCPFLTGLVLIVLILTALAITGCQNGPSPGFLGSGTLEGTEVNVSALTTGTIMNLTREEGQMVRAGALLAQIDVETLRLQRAQHQASLEEIKARRRAAEASLAEARDTLANTRSQFQRIKELHQRGSATRQQLDDVTTQLNVQKNNLAGARAQLSVLDAQSAQVQASIRVLERKIADGRIEAPLGGRIAEKYAETGEVATTGGRLYKIVDLDRFWLNIYLAEPDLGQVATGQAVEVRVDALDRPLGGRVAWTAQEAEFTPKNVQTKTARAELVYAVKVELTENPEVLKIGMPAEVYVK